MKKKEKKNEMHLPSLFSLTVTKIQYGEDSPRQPKMLYIYTRSEFCQI